MPENSTTSSLGEPSVALAVDSALSSRTERRAALRGRQSAFVLRRALVLSDVVAVAGALLLSFALLGTGKHALKDSAVGLVLLPLWVMLFKVYGLYDRDSKRISHSTLDDVPWVFHAMVFGALALWTCFRVLPVQKVDLAEGTGFFAIGFVGVLLGRTVVRDVLRANTAAQRVLLVADGRHADLLVRKMRGHPEYHLDPVGYLRVASVADAPAEIPLIGTLENLAAVCAAARIERVVVGPALDHVRLIDLVRTASNLNVPVSLMPDIVDVLGPSVAIDDVEGITLLGINPPLLTRSSRWLKRAMDIVISLVAALVLAVVMAAVALAVKLTSDGPVLFVQERLGQDGRRFRLYKFRTMVQDAEEKLESLRAQSTDPHWVLVAHDPRITTVGRFLRRASLDELPQLFNVLKGDMSLVGPRPLTPTDHAQVSAWGQRRLDLTPGITGVWQVLGRTRIPFEEMVKLDYLYVTNWSLWGDVRLLIRTLPSVLRRRGAN